jgi:hypothetical protein
MPKNLTGATYFHLFAPVFLWLAFTDGSINKPAQVPYLKLPGRTFFSEFFRAFSRLPAGQFSFIFQRHPGDQEKKLPLNMHGYGARTLLITADGLQGNTQKRCHLFLGLFQLITEMSEFLTVHGNPMIKA